MRMHGFILNRGLSPVFILMEQAKKNAFKMASLIFVHGPLVRMCYM